MVSHNIEKLTEDYISSRLEHDIESLITTISFDKTNKLTIQLSQVDQLYNRPFSGHYYSIKHQGITYRSRSLWDQTLSVKEIKDNSYHKTYDQGPENQLLIVISRHFNKLNQTFSISLAEDLTPVKEDINQFKAYFSILASVIMISLLFLQIIILRNGLSPLRKIQHELHALEKGTITELSTDVPHEIKSVVDEVNNLTLALYKRVKRSRDALSDLSHAIKKPLTLLQNFTDTNQSTHNNEENIFLNEQIENIRHITDRILKRARVSGSTKLNIPFSLKEDLPLLTKTMNAMYPNKHLNVKFDIPEELDSQFDREDMLELLGNLLDNAWKWANDKVNITIKEENGIIITIEDDGPGADESSLNELANRGVRLDESMDGYGFGLAISADIVRDYYGTLLFSRSENLGGFKTEVNIPVKN